MNLFTSGRDRRDEHAIVVIGLGRFGRALAMELVASGVEVLGIDGDEAVVQELSAHLTHCVRADSTNEEALRQLGVPEFQRAVVGIGTNIEASLLTASLLKQLGVPNIWAKAISEPHGRILEQLEIGHVVFPEHDMGQRLAHLVMGRMLDFIQFESDYAMAKTAAPSFLLGKALSDTGVRRKHGVTVVGVKHGGSFTHATGETVLEPGDTIIVSGVPSAVQRFSDLR